MAEERGGAAEERDQEAATATWQRALWAMVGIQFINTMAFSVLSPIMPLFLPVLGVETPSAVAMWSGVLNGVTSFIAAFASPLWGRVADRRGRKLSSCRSWSAHAPIVRL
jgi:DHA1 family multidrug resistance protein-like MFS transporter